MKRENPTHPMDEMSSELTRLRREVRRLKTKLREAEALSNLRQYATEDYSGEAERLHGWLRAVHHLASDLRPCDMRAARKLLAGIADDLDDALRGKPAPRRNKP